MVGICRLCLLSNSKVSLVFQQNGQMVVDGANGLSIEPVSGSLIISNFTTNQAKYSCSVSNVLGQQSALANVTLNIAPEGNLHNRNFENIIIINPCFLLAATSFSFILASPALPLSSIHSFPSTNLLQHHGSFIE